MEAQLEALGTGELFGLWFQSLFVGLTMNALSICIMLVIYGRMIEVYLTTSVGPIPLATMTNRDCSHTGQNYFCLLYTSPVFPLKTAASPKRWMSSQIRLRFASPTLQSVPT